MEKTEDFQERVLQIRRGRKGEDAGMPCYWENVKDFDDMTRVTFILDSFGDPKVPIYSRYGTEDRLVPIIENDYIVKVFFEGGKSEDNSNHMDVNRLGIGVSLLKIKDIDKYSNNAIVDLVLRKSPESEDWIYNSNIEFEGEAKELILNKLYNVIKGTK